ncbi:ABC transporter ATP-binding protein [Enterococcus sp. AZ067]|jgi:ABC-type multidrug transport system fused ATPase/permease subunit|uniref:ABC transporter ATP-binding protein n=1 Tax=Enterococcus sp. AZ067 TaxID=2774674 RepID=UPI003F692E00
MKIVIVIVLVLISLLISFSIPWLNKILLDEILTNQQFDLLKYIVPLYVIAALVSILLALILPILSSKINEEIVANLRKQLSSHFFYDENNSLSFSTQGDLLNVYNKNIPEIASLISKTFKDTVEYTITLISTISILVYLEPKIAILSLLSIPFYLFLPIIFKSKIKQASSLVQKKQVEINAKIEEEAGGFNQIRIFNKQSQIIKTLSELFDSLIPLKVQQVKYIRYASATMVIYWVNMLFVLWIGGSQVVNGRMTIGSLLILLNYVDRIEWPITRLTQVMSEFQSAIVSCARYSKYVPEKHEQVIKNEDGVTLDSIYKIDLKNISYKVHNSQDYLIKDSSFSITLGEKICITGKSGVGKTTFVHLMLGFLKQTEGIIEMNGVDFERLNLYSIRECIGFMSQDIFLFETSLLENIKFGSSDPNVTEAQVIEAAKKAQAHEFIIKLPDGYESIYKKDMNLSTGQKQRIALSRIILRNPDVIILDEPTSSLDMKTSNEIYKAIFDIFGEKKILIVITHQELSTVKFDRYYRMEDRSLTMIKNNGERLR